MTYLSAISQITRLKAFKSATSAASGPSATSSTPFIYDPLIGERNESELVRIYY